VSDSVRAAVIGAGSWGTAFGKVLADAGCEVMLWARRPSVAAAISDARENADYLPGVRLPDRLSATSDTDEAMDGAELVVLAVPAQTMRANLSGLAGRLPLDATLVSLAKGVELGTHKRMTQVIIEVTGASTGRVAVVSGPNLAREIAMEQPAATVVACTDVARCELLQRASTTGYLRAYTNADVIGCELGGAVKNVIALACGMAEGMGFGDNTKASLMTRGLAETSRLGIAMGADPLTFAGLAGLGDLAATCFSPLSRNRTFGERLGRGETLEQAVAHSSQTAEGVKSCLSILELAESAGVDMPITEQVVKVCHEGVSPVVAMSRLMKREPKSERPA
jgi:glycerol-3-phosphate dehydrogenase (NAD(P)+)